MKKKRKKQVPHNVERIQDFGRRGRGLRIDTSGGGVDFGALFH